MTFLNSTFKDSTVLLLYVQSIDHGGELPRVTMPRGHFSWHILVQILFHLLALINGFLRMSLFRENLKKRAKIP